MSLKERLTKVNEKQQMLQVKRAVLASKVAELQNRADEIRSALREAGIDPTDPKAALTDIQNQIEESLVKAERFQEDLAAKLDLIDKKIEEVS